MTRTASAPHTVDIYRAARTLLRIGLVLGVGVAGTLDEVVLHQVLQWHTFYVSTTAYWRIAIDGLFHAFSSAMLITGALLLWRQRHLLTSLERSQPLVAGVLLGAGGFNLYDGTIQHKVLRLHPVREGVTNILPYDIAWIGVALVVLLLGWLNWRDWQRHEP